MNNWITLFFMPFLFSIGNAKTLIVCTEASPSTFNPQMAIDAPTFNASSVTLYNRLVKFELGTTTIIPSLAKSYTISPDGLEYTFYLKKNVHFHQRNDFKPTRVMDASDVIFSIDRQRLSEHPYHRVGGGNYPQFASNIGDAIEKIQAIDLFTVKISLKKPMATFLSMMAGQYMSILSKEYADLLLKKGQKENIDLNPIGTGPFQLVDYKKDSFIKYKIFDEYFDQFKSSNKIDKLILAITPDANVRFQKLKNNECQFVTLPHLNDIEIAKKSHEFNVISEEGLNIGYLAMNTTISPFNNKNIRKAIALSLDRKKYLEIIYHNEATIAKGVLPPKNYGYVKETKSWDMDLQLAKRLMESAGFKNGFDTDLMILPVARPYNPDGKKMGELMQHDLAQIGIKVHLKQFEWQTFLQKAKLGEMPLVQFGWTGNNEPHSFLGDLLSCQSIKSGGNVARFCHEEFSKLIDEALVTPELSKRKKLYEKAQAIFQEERPWVPLFHGKVFRILSKNIEQYRIDPFGYDYFDRVEIKN